MVCSNALVTCVSICIVTTSDISLGALASTPTITYFTLYRYISSTSTFALALNAWYLVSAICGAVLFVGGVIAVCCYISSQPRDRDVMPPTPGNVCITDGEDGTWLNDIDYEPLVEPSDAGTEAV